MPPEVIAGIAASLFEAERDARPIPRLTGRHEGLDTAGAYAVQEQYVSLRRAGGANVVGRKIGCTARALQQMFGIDTPDFGHLLDDMRVEGDALIELDRLIEPMVEPEIAFLLGSDLEGPHATPEDVLRATAAVMPAIEIIDSRIVGWNIAFEDTVADNGSSALFVLGKERELEAGLDLGGESVSLRRDGSEFDSDRATAVLGHPLNSVAWLVNALAEFGRGMHAGEVVLSGSITKAARVRGGEVYEAIFSTLGRVGCRFKNGEGGSEGA